MSRTRIAVFEQMPLFRAGITQVLNADTAMEVVAEGDTIAEAVRVNSSVDVMVVDSDLLGAALAPSATLGSLCAKMRVILLTFALDEEKMRAAFSAGVRGYVLKGGGRHELLDAIRAACRDEGYVSPALAALLMRGRGDVAQSARSPTQLTHREGQIFDLLSAGLKNQEIGKRLNLSEKSIKRYVTCIFEKLKVRNRVEAAMLSRSHTGPAVAAAPGYGHTNAIAHASSFTSPLLGVTSVAAIVAAASGYAGSVANPHIASRKRGPVEKPQMSSSTRCFNAVFGRSWLSVEDLSRDPESSPLGTHIVL